MNSDVLAFADHYVAELRESNAAAFIGAGLSKAAGFVDWAELLTPIAKELGLDARKETDLVALAQFHLNTNASHRHHLNQLLIDKFSDVPEPTPNHKILARLPIQTFWTTNYDRLLERALEANGKRVDAKYTTEQLAHTRRGRDAVVYKMHGDIEHPNKAILTKDDYERYHISHAPFITALSGDLVEKTFVFLGFSFSDPNLDFVLSRIRSQFSTHQRQHFCITKKRTKRRGERKTDHEYAATKQALMTQDLLRFNIKTIFVDDYSDITAGLRHIENRFRSQTVFISGSADDYSPWGHAATQAFLKDLARNLIGSGFRIASGCGSGIGGPVVTGAIEQIYSTSHHSIDERLLLRPFPVAIADPKARQRTYDTYRRELVAQAGVAIFVAGNTEIDGKVVNAKGVRAEFEIAKQMGLHLVPIGSSGWMASELWKLVMDDLATYYPGISSKAKSILQQLGGQTSNPSALITPILEIIKLITKE